MGGWRLPISASNSVEPLIIRNVMLVLFGLRCFRCGLGRVRFSSTLHNLDRCV